MVYLLFAVAFLLTKFIRFRTGPAFIECGHQILLTNFYHTKAIFLEQLPLLYWLTQLHPPLSPSSNKTGLSGQVLPQVKHLLKRKNRYITAIICFSFACHFFSITISDGANYCLTDSLLQLVGEKPCCCSNTVVASIFCYVCADAWAIPTCIMYPLVRLP